MKHGIILLLFCPAVIHATLTLEQIEEAQIEYWKWTSKDEVSNWTVRATKEDLQHFKNLLAFATAATDPEITWFVSSYKGYIKTDNGDYTIALGAEKTAKHTYRISLYPKGNPNDRKTMHFLLPKDAGKDFSIALQKFLESKTQRKPDYVERR